MAWNNLFLPWWLNSDGRKHAVVEKLRDMLTKLAPDQQPRWLQGGSTFGLHICSSKYLNIKELNKCAAPDNTHNPPRKVFLV